MLVCVYGMAFKSFQLFRSKFMIKFFVVVKMVILDKKMVADRLK